MTQRSPAGQGAQRGAAQHFPGKDPVRRLPGVPEQPTDAEAEIHTVGDGEGPVIAVDAPAGQQREQQENIQPCGNAVVADGGDLLPQALEHGVHDRVQI